MITITLLRPKSDLILIRSDFSFSAGKDCLKHIAIPFFIRNCGVFFRGVQNGINKGIVATYNIIRELFNVLPMKD